MPNDTEYLRNKWTPSARLILCLMVFWGQIQNYMMRANLSILIVAMIRDSPKNITLNSTNTVDLELTCPENRIETVKDDMTSAKESIDDGLDWDEIMKGKVIGAFSIGYVLTQVHIFDLIFLAHSFHCNNGNLLS